MSGGTKSRLSYANIMATVAVFLALGGGAYALTGVPDRGGVFHGCVSNKTGLLRVVKSPSSCVKPRTRGKHRTRGEFAVRWNQHGQLGHPGQRGQPGPGAVKLYFDRAADSQLITLGTIGAWTIKAQCNHPGNSVPAALTVLVDGPGSANVAFTEQSDSDAPAARMAHDDLTTDDTVFSFGVLGGHQDRVVGTMVLSADPATPVGQVSFLAVDDSVTPGGHCSFIGTATPAA